MVVNVTDFLALEVKDGKLKYYLNFGSTTQIGVLQKVNSIFLYSSSI